MSTHEVEGQAQVAPVDWGRLAGFVRAELVRADWTERQFRVAEFLVSATIDCQRQEVRGIKYEPLGNLLQLSKGNLSDVLGELAKCGFVQVVPDEDGVCYRVIPDSDLWSTRWRYERYQYEQYLRGLDLVTGQVQAELIEPGPCLDEALASTALENAVRKDERPTSNVQRPTSNATRDDEGGQDTARKADGNTALARFSLSKSLRENTGVEVGGESKSTLMILKHLKSTELETRRLQVSPSSVNSNVSTDFSEAAKVVSELGAAAVHQVPKLGTGAMTSGQVWERWEVPARNWAKDEDVMKYLGRCTPLKAELWAGRTTLAQLFCGLYAQRRQTAVELVGTAVNMRRANAFLNEAVLEEFGLRKSRVNHQDAKAPSGEVGV
jgi:hypothetical protein